MPQVMPTIGETLSPILAQITDGVARLIDPGYKTRAEMHEKLLADPEYRQKMVDFFQANPDQLKTLSKKDQGIIGGQKASVGEMNKEGMEKNIAALLQQPGSSEDAARAALKMDSKIDEQTKQAKLEQSNFENELNLRTKAGISYANQYMLDNPDVKIPAIVKGTLAGTIDPKVLSGLFNDPQYGGAAKTAWEDYSAKQRLEMEKGLHHQDTLASMAQQEMQFEVSHALAKGQYYGISDTESLRNYLFNPQVRALIASGQPLPPVYQAIKDKMDAVGSPVIDKQLEIERASATNIIKNIATVKDPNQRKAMVDNLNSVYQREGMLSEQPPKFATISDDTTRTGPHWYNRTHVANGVLHIVDGATGQPVLPGGQPTPILPDSALFKTLDNYITDKQKSNPAGWRADLTSVIKRAKAEGHNTEADALAAKYHVDLGN